MPRGSSSQGRLAELKVRQSGKRFYASKCADEIRVAFKQGKRGVWRKFVLDFSKENGEGCLALGTSSSGSEAKAWVLESPAMRRVEVVEEFG